MMRLSVNLDYTPNWVVKLDLQQKWELKNLNLPSNLGVKPGSTVAERKRTKTESSIDLFVSNWIPNSSEDLISDVLFGYAQISDLA